MHDGPALPVGIADARHYLWGECCDGWHLLEHDGLSVIQERVPPGVAETRHRHRLARQFFFVLQGQAVIEVEGQRHALGEGQGLHVAPELAHQFRNESAADVVFLVISTPRSHGDRHAAPHAGEPIA